MVPKLLVLAVEFHRAPTRFRHLTNPSQPLPPDFGAALPDICSALSPRNVEATSAALGLTPSALNEALLFFLRHTLLASKADRYRMLGLSKGCPADAIKHHHRLLMQLLHPDRATYENPGRVELSARINAAYRALRDSDPRARNDAEPAQSALVAVHDLEGIGLSPPKTCRMFVAGRRIPARKRRQRTPPFTLVAVGAVSAGALAFFVLLKPEQPMLAMRPECAENRATRPLYLQAFDDAPATAGSGPSATPMSARRSMIGRAPCAPSPRAAATGLQSAPPDTSDRPTTRAKGILSPMDAGLDKRPLAPEPHGRGGMDRQSTRSPARGTAMAPDAEVSAAVSAAAAVPPRSGRASATQTPGVPWTSSADWGGTSSLGARTGKLTAAPIAARPSRGADDAWAGSTPPLLRRRLPDLDRTLASPELPQDAANASRRDPVEIQGETARPSGPVRIVSPRQQNSDIQEPEAPKAETATGREYANSVSRPLPKTRQPVPPAQQARDDAPGERAASNVINQLKRSYTNGDLRGLTGLFTANALIDQGAGHAAIRRWYAAAFEQDRQRQISIFNLRWRQGPHQRLLGEGEIRLMGRESRASEWHQESGTIEIELVPWQGQYRIAKMNHRLSRR